MSAAANFTFGIEIECLMPAVAFDNAGWSLGAYHAGRQIPNFPQGWNAQRDNSLRAIPGFWAVEVVSPILRGLDGLASVRTVVEKLNEMGARVNSSCGFHVHVGWNGDDAALRRLIALVAHHEKALYAASGTRSREQGAYCQSVKLSARHKAIASLPRDVASAAIMNTDRYRVLNLQNLACKRTVEFRVFSGTLNAIKIAAYIQMALAMVEKALSSKRTPNWEGPAAQWLGDGGRARMTEGCWALRQFMAAMNWWGNARNARPAIGVLDAALIPEMASMLRRLAEKYDGVAR